MFASDGQEKKTADGKKQTAWWQPAVSMFLKLSVWIAAPVVIGLFIGNWLDSKYHTAPWLFLLSIGIAFIISIIGLVKNTVTELKKIEEQGKDSPKIQDNNKKLK